MKKIAALFVFSALLVACSSEQYGAGISVEAPTVKVKDIVFNPSLQNKVVNLEGIIIGQCQRPKKCWFFLHDGTGSIFINQRPKPGGPANFYLPSSVGKKAKVTGVVTSNQDGLQVIASGVEVI